MDTGITDSGLGNTNLKCLTAPDGVETELEVKSITNGTLNSTKDSGPDLD
jgi:hypothetical protein